MNRWPQVAAWIEALRAEQPDVGLSERGAAVALQRSLDALSAVPAHAERLAPPHTVIVCASTVFTAPLEWAAVLLARGGRVTLKAPRTLERWFARVADLTPLPLESTTDRAVLAHADCIVAMGSNATLDAIRSGLYRVKRLLLEASELGSESGLS